MKTEFKSDFVVAKFLSSGLFEINFLNSEGITVAQRYLSPKDLRNLLKFLNQGVYPKFSWKYFFQKVWSMLLFNYPIQKDWEKLIEFWQLNLDFYKKELEENTRFTLELIDLAENSSELKKKYIEVMGKKRLKFPPSLYEFKSN